MKLLKIEAFKIIAFISIHKLFSAKGVALNLRVTWLRGLCELYDILYYHILKECDMWAWFRKKYRATKYPGMTSKIKGTAGGKEKNRNLASFHSNLPSELLVVYVNF